MTQSKNYLSWIYAYCTRYFQKDSFANILTVDFDITTAFQTDYIARIDFKYFKYTKWLLERNGDMVYIQVMTTFKFYYFTFCMAGKFPVMPQNTISCFQGDWMRLECVLEILPCLIKIHLSRNNICDLIPFWSVLSAWKWQASCREVCLWTWPEPSWQVRYHSLFYHSVSLS